jgi:SH3-like domain-containing protein
VVEVLGESQTAVGLEWRNVRDPKGREGWVAAQYLIINP